MEITISKPESNSDIHSEIPVKSMSIANSKLVSNDDKLRDCSGTSEEEEEDKDAFLIMSNRTSARKEWRKVTLVLNALWRFRHTGTVKTDIKVKKGELVSKFKTVTYVVVAAQRFEDFGMRKLLSTSTEDGDRPIPQGFGTGPSHLGELMRDQNLSALQTCGGVQNIGRLQKSNVDGGIDDNVDQVERRKEAFGSNKIPRPGTPFSAFVHDACQDLALNILFTCALVKFGTEMWSKGPKEVSWYDDLAIYAEVVIVIRVRSSLAKRSHWISGI